jgi:hypothetical protein
VGEVGGCVEGVEKNEEGWETGRKNGECERNREWTGISLLYLKVCPDIFTARQKWLSFSPKVALRTALKLRSLTVQSQTGKTLTETSAGRHLFLHVNRPMKC